MFACEGGYLEIVKLFLKYKASIEIISSVLNILL